MSRPIRLPKFWVLATVQVALFVGIAATWFYFRTKAYLAGPPDPDLYAWSWDFQLMVFALFWLPATLLLTGILIGIERVALRPYYRATSEWALQQGRHGP
jgi:hypothetical protein